MQNSTVTTVLTNLDKELACLASHVCDPHLLRLQASDLPTLNAIRDKLGLISNYADTLRNSISPINNLPCELLATIFHAAAHNPALVTEPTQPRRSRAAHVQTLVRLTHVCHHWRTLCLASPILWTKIVFEPEQDNTLMSLILRRSHPAPLDVDLTIRDIPATRLLDTSQAALYDVTAEIQVMRYKRLRVSIRSPAQLLGLKGLRSPAPILEELTIDIMPSVRQLFQAEPLPTMFSGVMPCLKRLKLAQLAVMTGDQCRNLTTLVLSQQNYSDPNFPSLISLLEASPTLESLTFDRVLLKDFSSPVRISLARLRELTCNCRLSDAGIILRLLKLPEDVNTTFQIDMDHSINIGGSMSLATDSFPSALTQISRATRISVAKYHSQSLITGTGPSFSFTFDFRGSFAMSERQYMMESVCKLLHLEGIEEAHILGSDTTRVAAFFKLNLPKLTSLSKLILDLYDTPALELLQHLHHNPETNECPCPRLVDLSLVDFRSTHWHVLENLARTRKAAGFPIKTIAVHPSHLSFSEIRELWPSMEASLRDQVDTLVLQRLLNDPKLVPV